MLRRLKDFTHRVYTYLAVAAGVAVLAMFAVIIYDVSMRYFFLRPTRWALDVGEMLMLPVTFLPAALLLRLEGHIRVDVLVLRLRGRPRAIAELTTCLLGLVWSLLITWRGWLTFAEFLQRGKTSQMAELPMYPAVLIIPIGGAFLTLEFLIRVAEEIAALKSKFEMP